MVTVDTGQRQDPAHLHPAARTLSQLPTEERLQRIRADRWIGYPKARAAVERLDVLFGWPRKQRMPNLLLIGPTNNGKSMIIERFRRAHPARTRTRPGRHPRAVPTDAAEPVTSTLLLGHPGRAGRAYTHSRPRTQTD